MFEAGSGTGYKKKKADATAALERLKNPDAIITDPRPVSSTQGVGQAADGVVKPGVGGVNLPGADGTHYEYTDTGTRNSGTENIGDYRVIKDRAWEAPTSEYNPDSNLPYGIGDAATAGTDLAALLGNIPYTSQNGGGATDPRISQYQQQLQGYLDEYGQPVSYDKTWGDLTYEDLIRKALGMSYEDWTKGDAYAALAQRYGENGRNAMLDTLGQISARTGGLASSYATAASAQQYNEYMKLLEDAARAAYDKERGYVIENAGLAQGVGNQEYNRWMDIYGLNQDNRDRAVNIVNDLLGYAYRDDDTAYSRGMTERDEARDRIASYLGNGGSIGDLDPALITASGLTTPELTKLEAAYQQPVYSGGGYSSGGGSGSGTNLGNYDWSGLDAWVHAHGAENASAYINNHYKEMGFSSKTAANDAYAEYALQKGYTAKQKPELSLDQATKLLENGTVNDKTLSAYEYWTGQTWDDGGKSEWDQIQNPHNQENGWIFVQGYGMLAPDTLEKLYYTVDDNGERAVNQSTTKDGKVTYTKNPKFRKN